MQSRPTFNVSRIFANVGCQELRVELEFVAAVDSSRIDARLGSIKGVHMIAEAIFL